MILKRKIPQLLSHSYSSGRQSTPVIDSNTIVNIPKSNIYPFGASNTSKPVFQDVDWVVREGEAWAVVGDGSGEKKALFQALLGHLRISPFPPPPGGLFPFLSLPSPRNATPKDPYSNIAFVSFGHRQAPGGAFYDFTSRYGAVRDEDRVTLRESMFPRSVEKMPDPFEKEDRERGIVRQQRQEEEEPPMTLEEKRFFDMLIEQTGLTHLLDVPRVALSNGQTRRARIVKAILGRPELLLLDEPWTGLDATSRPRLLSLLHDLHSSRTPRVIMGLRTQDALPDWVTHLALVKGGRVNAGLKADVLKEANEKVHPVVGAAAYRSNPKDGETIHHHHHHHHHHREEGGILIDMQDVNVSYGPRTVLSGINWQIQQGDRWHLQGSNGSGKTTLLSLLTGDHPQSYTQKHLHLPVHSPPSSQISRKYQTNHRNRIPTRYLQQLIGVVSPELFDAFPRRYPGMTVWEAVGTGFSGEYVSRGPEGLGDISHEEPHRKEEELEWRMRRMWHVLEGLGPSSWNTTEAETAAAAAADAQREATATTAANARRESAAEFSQRRFSSLSVGEQRLALLMRALVGRPPVVLLDEVWSGMDESMVRSARRYLRGEGAANDLEPGVTGEQAVVVVTHWENEVPWDEKDGVKKFRLEDGRGSIIMS